MFFGRPANVWRPPHPVLEKSHVIWFWRSTATRPSGYVLADTLPHPSPTFFAGLKTGVAFFVPFAVGFSKYQVPRQVGMPQLETTRSRSPSPS